LKYGRCRRLHFPIDGFRQSKAVSGEAGAGASGSFIKTFTSQRPAFLQRAIGCGLR